MSSALNTESERDAIIRFHFENPLDGYRRLAFMMLDHDIVTVSPYYPQSNGKIERDHRTIKHDCIRAKTPLTLKDAPRVVAEFVQTYNEKRRAHLDGRSLPFGFWLNAKILGHDARLFR